MSLTSPEPTKRRNLSSIPLPRGLGRSSQSETGPPDMDQETKALLRSISHHLKWVIALLVAILAFLLAQSLAGA